MAVNRYDTPAQADFINTYVPIPFEQLFTLGKQQKADVDKAIEDFGKAKKLWSEFQSESLKDMQTWDTETMGRVRPVINDMAKNLDLIKTAEGRMRLQSAINSVDTGLLGRLKQSAKNFELRKAAIQKLMLDGKYNPYWHDLDMTGWDSTKQGVFNDINVTPYQSVNDLVHPYVDNLEASDMGTRGGRDYFGVSEDRTRAQVDANITEILNTPGGKMHVQAYVKQGYTPEQAIQQVTNEVYRAAKEAAWERSEVNPYALAEYKSSLAQRAAAKKLGNKDDETPNPDVYSQAYATADQLQKSKLLMDSDFSPMFDTQLQIQREIQEVWLPALQNGQITESQFNRQMQDYKKQLDNVPDISSVARNVFTKMTGDIIPTVGVANDRLKDYSRGTSMLLDRISTNADAVTENEWYRQRANNEIELAYNNTPMKAYAMPSTKDMMLDIELANKIMKVSPAKMKLEAKDKNGLYRNVAEDIKNGRFHNIMVVPSNEHLPITDANGEASLYSRVKVLIPRSAIENAGYDISSFDDMYENKIGKKISNQTSWLGSNSPLKVKIKDGNKDYALEEDYYEFDANSTIPSYGALRAGYNQAGNKAYGGSTMQNSEYSTNLDQSFSKTYNDALKVLD